MIIKEGKVQLIKTELKSSSKSSTKDNKNLMNINKTTYAETVISETYKEPWMKKEGKACSMFKKSRDFKHSFKGKFRSQE